MDRYAREMVNDIKGELTVIYDPETVDNILTSLKECTGPYLKNFPYNRLIEELQFNGIKDTNKVISDLFDYSLIGNYDENGNVCFRYREAPGQVVELNTQQDLILHNVLRTYFKKN